MDGIRRYWLNSLSKVSVLAAMTPLPLDEQVMVYTCSRWESPGECWKSEGLLSSQLVSQLVVNFVTRHLPTALPGAPRPCMHDNSHPPLLILRGWTATPCEEYLTAFGWVGAWVGADENEWEQHQVP